MTEEQITLSTLYELQEVVIEGSDFSNTLNVLVGELETRIQEQHLTPLL